MSKPAIGFIGLGLMGGAMCQRLLDKGYSLTVMANRSRTEVDKAVKRGAKEVKTAKEIAEASDIVMLCMDTSASVESRMRGPEGVIAGLRKGATVIDFGTSLPDSTVALGEEVAAAGGAYLDSPISRTPAQARDGMIILMCSGDQAAFAKVQPTLQDLAETAFHLGPLGTGHKIKLINNFYSMTTAMAMSEAFAMADATGVAREKLYQVMSVGPNHSGMMDFIKANAIDGDPTKLSFAVKNARKDVGYYAQMADAAGAVSLMSSNAKQTLSLGVANGYGDRNVPEMLEFFEKLYAAK
ncbi:NAD(P)-dependent oxidoreductase [Pikeienuella sp. HZG-20]|uniref:NAD(P)-dependent oxidoreductase n=1 Tax=Paludibacillus litoralis TaxID=3133267 RepID=UPI0030EC3B13